MRGIGPKKRQNLQELSFHSDKCQKPLKKTHTAKPPPRCSRTPKKSQEPRGFSRGDAGSIKHTSPEKKSSKLLGSCFLIHTPKVEQSLQSGAFFWRLLPFLSYFFRGDRLILRDWHFPLELCFAHLSSPHFRLDGIQVWRQDLQNRNFKNLRKKNNSWPKPKKTWQHNFDHVCFKKCHHLET